MPLPQPKTFTEDDYYNLPEDVRAELIDGQIYYMAAPSRIHQEILMELAGTIHNYIKQKDRFCHVYPAPFAVRLSDDKKNIVEPDISVICDPDKLTDQGCTGAPDWIIEIVSPGNPGHDYITKLHLYAIAGVREYWIIDIKKQAVLVYYFKEDDFDVQHYTFQDKIKVKIYDDLYINYSELNF